MWHLLALSITLYPSEVEIKFVGELSYIIFLNYQCFTIGFNFVATSVGRLKYFILRKPKLAKFMAYYVLQKKSSKHEKKQKTKPKWFPCLKVGFPLNALAVVKRFSYFVLRNQICQ